MATTRKSGGGPPPASSGGGGDDGINVVSVHKTLSRLETNVETLTRAVEKLDRSVDELKARVSFARGVVFGVAGLLTLAAAGFWFLLDSHVKATVNSSISESMQKWFTIVAVPAPQQAVPQPPQPQPSQPLPTSPQR